MGRHSPKACSGYPVYDAAAKGSVEEVKELIRRGHSPDRSPTSCPPPLYRAVRFNRPDMALALIEAWCQVKMSKRLEQHNSPIITLAADLNMTEVVLKMCLNPDCEVFATDGQLRTIVHLAVARRNYDLVRRLPLHCFPRKFLSLRDGMCLTPLHLAASLGDLTMLLLLLRMGERSDSQPTAALSGAAPQQDGDGRNLETEAVSVAVQCHEPVVNGETAEDQLVSVQPSHAVAGEVMAPECTSSMSVSHSGVSPRPLVSDRESNSREGARGTSTETCPRDSTQFPVSLAAHIRDRAGTDERDGASAKSRCRSLSDRVSAGGESLSQASVRRKRESRSEHNAGTGEGSGCVASGGMPPSAQWKVKKALIDLPVLGSKETMLHFAARGRHLEVVEFLLSQGADVNAQNMMKNSPLHLLCMQGRANSRAVAVARLLLEAGADCNLKGTFQHVKKQTPHHQSGVTPAISDAHREVTVDMVAAIRNRVALLRVLGEFGVQFDSVNYAHMTTLMLALSHGSEEAAMFLLTRCGEKSPFNVWLDRKGNTVFHHVVHCKAKAASLTQLMLDQSYVVTMPSPSQPLSACPVCSRFCQGFGDVKWHSRMPSMSQSYTPLTWAIRHKRLGVVERLVRHDPSFLLRGIEDLDHSPLHVVLQWMPGEESVPFIDFLLAHGSDGNAEVCGLTPYELALQTKGDGVAESNLYAAGYLKKKLGATFVVPDPWRLEHFGQLMAMVRVCPDHTYVRRAPPARRLVGGGEVKRLRDMCLGPVRQLVREWAVDYFAGVSSLPLPATLIDDLLFRNGK